MGKHLDVGIIGLGKFGLSMAVNLRKKGHNVLGIDCDEKRTALAQDKLEHVYTADCTQTAVLSSLHFQELDYVLVSLGDSVEQSLNIALNLQDLNVPHIWVKAANDEHKRILLRLGVERVIMPEVDAAYMTAYQMMEPSVIDLIPSYGGVAIRELSVSNWDGKSLVELNLIQKYTVLVLGIRRSGEAEVEFVPSGQAKVFSGDTLILVGKLEDIEKIRA